MIAKNILIQVRPKIICSLKFKFNLCLYGNFRAKFQFWCKTGFFSEPRALSTTPVRVPTTPHPELRMDSYRNCLSQTLRQPWKLILVTTAISAYQLEPNPYTLGSDIITFLISQLSFCCKSSLSQDSGSRTSRPSSWDVPPGTQKHNRKHILVYGSFLTLGS